MRVPKISDTCFVILSLTLFVFVFGYSTKDYSDCSISFEQHIGCAKTKLYFNQAKTVVETATSTVQAILDNILFNGGSKNVIYVVNGQINNVGSITENSRQCMSVNETFKYIYAVNGGEKKVGSETSETLNLYLVNCGPNKDGSKTTENKDDFRKTILLFKDAKIKS